MFVTARIRAWRSDGWRDYLALCKPRIVMLIVFTAMVGMLLSVPVSEVAWNTFFYASLGIGLAAASAATINHLVDARIDAMMARTQHRPLPQGRVDVSSTILFALLLSLLSVLILCWQVNLLTAVLTILSLVGYGFIYSMFLKRATPQNIVIGGAAGAAPPVLGWTAMTGVLDAHALLLFLIIFAWTPPHFWTLAICRKDDYANAGVPMLPVTHGNQFTRVQILLYTVVLFLVCLLPYLVYMSGLIYLAGALLLNSVFLYYAVCMQFDRSNRLAMRTFQYSIIYLLLLFACLLIDHQWRLFWV